METLFFFEGETRDCVFPTLYTERLPAADVELFSRKRKKKLKLCDHYIIIVAAPFLFVRYWSQIEISQCIVS